jgi:hypothetical protein
MVRLSALASVLPLEKWASVLVSLLVRNSEQQKAPQMEI